MMEARVIFNEEEHRKNLRDWFAGMALLKIGTQTSAGVHESVVAKMAYDIADAMIAERNKDNDQ